MLFVIRSSTCYCEAVVHRFVPSAPGTNLWTTKPIAVSQTLVKFLCFWIIGKSSVDFVQTGISICIFHSLRKVLPVAQLVYISVRRNFVLLFFTQCRYSFQICLMLMTSGFLSWLTKVLSVHLKQQLLYGTGIRCNIKH